MKAACSRWSGVLRRRPARVWATARNSAVVYGSICRKARVVAAFTLVEAMVAISVLGIGVASAVGALTKFNSIASISRNATGAYAAVMNQIDLIQSDAPFNPGKTNPDGTAQIPPELQLGTQTQNNVPIYQDPNTGVVVSGTMTTTVSDISSTYTQGGHTYPVTMYQAVVTVTYTYLSRNYSFSMSTIRASDI
jgi:type II secretory pathway pseudopilin PulG